jgi:integrase
MEDGNSKKRWERTNVTNLVRHGQSGTYYARVKVNGKEKWRTLKTKLFSVAKLKLGDVEREERSKGKTVGSLTLPDDETSAGRFVTAFLKEEVSHVRQKKPLSPATKLRREIAVKALLKTWKGFECCDVRRITATDCQQWADHAQKTGTGFVAPKAKTVRVGMSASAYNKCVDALRSIMELARDAGLLYRNPAEKLGKRQVDKKQLDQLPTSEVRFAALVKSISEAGARQSADCADMVRLLAFSGLRLTEATGLRWKHVNREAGTLAVNGTKTSASRRILPLFPPLRALLDEIQARRGEESLDAPILAVAECKGALRSACKATGVPVMVHHDLRHLFATRCLQLGIDAPTVAKWLGHRDGGVLVMNTYGHATEEHGKQMAAKVNFGGVA